MNWTEEEFIEACKLCVDLSDGNPGAASVLGSLLRDYQKESTVIISILNELNITGSSIWIAYKDFAHCDLSAFHEAIRTRNPELLALLEKESE